jgi:hypothetical protein
MSLHFAAADSGECAVVARVLKVPRLRTAANDSEPGIGRDMLLRAALRHFAAYGLSAAERARENAENAFFAGNRDEYMQWLAICRALDRRVADGARVSRSQDRR